MKHAICHKVILSGLVIFCLLSSGFAWSTPQAPTNSSTSSSQTKASIAPFTSVTFPSKDHLSITADLYLGGKKTNPFIILFHMAGSSRGEYREIAPRLNKLGYNCIAIDQRSGEEMNGVVNETAKRAKLKGLTQTYDAAYIDMEAALAYVRTRYSTQKVIVWGSSYSSSLVFVLASSHPKDVSAIISFSPGEYFTDKNKIGRAAKLVTCPSFVTSAKSERNETNKIFIPLKAKNKTYYLPQTAGVHGSQALWKTTKDNAGYWQHVVPFLQKL